MSWRSQTSRRIRAHLLLERNRSIPTSQTTRNQYSGMKRCAMFSSLMESSLTLDVHSHGIASPLYNPPPGKILIINHKQQFLIKCSVREIIQFTVKEEPRPSENVQHKLWAVLLAEKKASMTMGRIVKWRCKGVQQCEHLQEDGGTCNVC